MTSGHRFGVAVGKLMSASLAGVAEVLSAALVLSEDDLFGAVVSKNATCSSRTGTSGDKASRSEYPLRKRPVAMTAQVTRNATRANTTTIRTARGFPFSV